jgi:hypothetical protein
MDHRNAAYWSSWTRMVVRRYGFAVPRMTLPTHGDRMSCRRTTDPGRDAYLSVKGGDVPDGRIVDHAELDALPAALRDTLMALWWEAFHRP